MTNTSHAGLPCCRGAENAIFRYLKPYPAGMRSSDYYNSISEGYEELHIEEQKAKLRLIKDEISRLWGFENIHTILDVGCGTGITSDFREYNIEVTGADPAKNLLEKAREKGIKTVRAEAESLPFRNSSFDLVTSITAIQNFNNIEKGLKEIRRVGKGMFCLSFLKKSKKRDAIKGLIDKIFKTEKKVEEDKDIIILASKR